MELIYTIDNCTTEYRLYNNNLYHLLRNECGEDSWMRKNFPKLTKKHLDTYDEFSYIVYSMSEDDFCKLKEVFGIGKNKDYPYAKFISSFSEEDQRKFAKNDISVFEKHIRLCCHQRDFIQKNSIKSLEIADEAKEIADEANKVKGKIYSEFIAIIGIFTAVSFALMGSIQTFGTVFSKVEDPSTASIGYAIIAGAIYLIIMIVLITVLFVGMKRVINANNDKIPGWIIWTTISAIIMLVIVGTVLIIIKKDPCRQPSARFFCLQKNKV